MVLLIIFNLDDLDGNPPPDIIETPLQSRLEILKLESKLENII